MTSKEIRKAFLDFFASKGHQIVPSAPMVVKNDPTLMFVISYCHSWFCLVVDISFAVCCYIFCRCLQHLLSMPNVIVSKVLYI